MLIAFFAAVHDESVCAQLSEVSGGLLKASLPVASFGSGSGRRPVDGDVDQESSDPIGEHPLSRFGPATTNQ
ncbi:MAG TPA: hypothetical protein VGJ45_25960 [Pseudonocardiaceae bacterium]|jgi:hypothetical protein